MPQTPALEPAEVGRLWRFSELKSYAAGDRIVTTGEIAPGAFVILAGRVEVTQGEVLSLLEKGLGWTLARLGEPTRSGLATGLHEGAPRWRGYPHPSGHARS